MKIVAICDSWEMCTSLRLAGIESFEVSVEGFSAVFNKAVSDDDTAMVLVSKTFTNQYSKQNTKQNLPLIMEL